MLGSDRWGDWIGQRRGAHSFRPGRDLLTDTANVSLIPADASDWVATFYPDEHPDDIEVYIDLVYDVRWSTVDRGHLLGIDMDLDVVRVRTIGAYIDDEDEFDDHAARWSYPVQLTAQLLHTAHELEHAVRDDAAPFNRSTWGPRLELVSGL